MDQTPSASSPDPQSLEAAETSAQPSTFPDRPRRLSSQEPSKITAKSPQVTLTETLDLPDGGDGDKQEKVDDCLMKDIRTHKLKSEKTKPENDVGVGPDPMESLDAEPSGTLNMATTTTQMKRPKIAGNMEKCDVNFQEYQERSGDQANQCTIGEELSINPSSDVLLADLFGDECCDGYSISVHDQEVSEIMFDNKPNNEHLTTKSSRPASSYSQHSESGSTQRLGPSPTATFPSDPATSYGYYPARLNLEFMLLLVLLVLLAH